MPDSSSSTPFDEMPSLVLNDRRRLVQYPRPMTRSPNLLPIVLAVSFLVVAITVRAIYVGGFDGSTLVVALIIAVVLCGVVVFDIRKR